MKIIEVLGKEVDMSFIEESEAQTYCKLVNESVEDHEIKTLKQHFTQSSPEILELLK